MSSGVACMVLFMAGACHANDRDARQPAQRGTRRAAVPCRRGLRGLVGRMLLDVRMNRRTVVISVVAGVVVLGGAAGGLVWQQQRAQAEQDRSLRAAAETFASAWSARALDRAGTSYAGRTPAQVAASFATVTKGLGTGPVQVTVGSVNRSGDTGKATLDVRWSLAGGATWAYSEAVPLKRTSNRWAVVADGSTSLWHPKVRGDQTLTATRTWGRRGAVLDRNGKPLLAIGTVYDVQIDPVRATPAAVGAWRRSSTSRPGH